MSARPAARTGTLGYGVPLREVLRVSTLAGARVLAGEAGLDRVVQRLNIMEVPDILPWVKPNELLLTTGYPLRENPRALAHLVRDLDERGLVALAIKLHRYIDRLPDEMLRQADELGFPVVEVPDGVGLDDILEQVLSDILNRQAAMLERSEEVHRALLQIVLEGGELTELAEELVTLVGGAVLITATDGRVLAAAGPPEDLDAVHASPCLDSRGRLRPDEPYGVSTHPGMAGEHAVVAIASGPVPQPRPGAGPARRPAVGERDHGRIAAWSRGRPLDDVDVHTLERAATVAALVVTKQLAVAAVEGKYRADFLRDVLDGRVRDAGRIRSHGASLGWDLDRPLVVAVSSLDPPAPCATAEGTEADRRAAQDRLVAAWAAAVRSRDPRAAVVGFAEEVVAVVGADRDTATGTPGAPEWLPAVAAGVLPGPRTCSVGVSRVAPAVEALPAAYEQGRRAMAIGRRTRGAGAFAEFDDLGVFRLLSLIPDSDELRAFVRETLGELAGDGPETADLRRTLRVLLETNVNVAEAARRLHFHYNTLRYRIGKLTRMVGPFTTDPTLRLELHLALHVERMRGL